MERSVRGRRIEEEAAALLLPLDGVLSITKTVKNPQQHAGKQAHQSVKNRKLELLYPKHSCKAAGGDLRSKSRSDPS